MTLRLVRISRVVKRISVYKTTWHDGVFLSSMRSRFTTRAVKSWRKKETPYSPPHTAAYKFSELIRSMKGRNGRQHENVALQYLLLTEVRGRGDTKGATQKKQKKNRKYKNKITNNEQQKPQKSPKQRSTSFAHTACLLCTTNTPTYTTNSLL